MKNIVVMALAVLVTGCSIKQQIEPAQVNKQSVLCIVENTDVRPGFVKEYQAALSDKGVAWQMVDERSIPSSCQWTSTYEARWSWDMAIYMSYANIKVFNQGQLDGEAIYDSSRGGANMGKFIDAEEKVRELVNELIQLKVSQLFSPRAV